ncbi:hypothetical protein FY036_06900 [Mesorhizobium microcysteis]|uniref:Uncharacterized protein n=1 Tax=Neoaquamicrobium microcysteis TaxID=2682781 RepID=A0A5D4H4P4_9HYPH|nr:hypothetical protein [Mesorhizobium microcysteis]TYR33770.1 hypothetical protein FY036_06900 [Mesorhizobium microcysteis]
MSEGQIVQCVSTTLGEIRDASGAWHTGYLPFAALAVTFNTTTADVLRRLACLGIVQRDARGRYGITQDARRLCQGEVIHRRTGRGAPTKRYDVILPSGMVLLARNLEATNEPQTEIEKLHDDVGLSMRAIGQRVGISAEAVSKHLRSRPPRLTDWPVIGSWEDGVAFEAVAKAA